MPPTVALLAVAGYLGFTWSRARSTLGVSRASTPAVAPDPGELRFLKGQLHLHSDNSGDGHAPPEEVARWYSEHGYDFIVFTDHNYVTRQAGHGSMLAIPGVELTANLATCEPAPRSGMSCNLHVNALFVDPARIGGAPSATASTRRLDVYARELEQASALGALAQVNHPNFRYGADADLLTGLAGRGARLLEIANEAQDSDNPGDADHPSTEALWDAVLTRGQTLYAVASDDAHDYDDAAERSARGEEVYTGDRGFVMVRAKKDAGSIRRALEQGDFYASTGVVLSRLEAGPGFLALEAAASSEGPHRSQLLGEGGRVLATVVGRSPRFELAGLPDRYVRAVVVDRLGHKAWTQPLRLAPAVPSGQRPP
ncbi:MAG: CehA/McbA family metallohydrolase [Myxococcaceae bacterium]